MSRITPFKKKTSTGEKWYEKLNILYTLNTRYFTSNLPISYNIPLYIAPGFQPIPREGTDTIKLSRGGFVDVLKSGQWGARHSIPISTTVKVLKYFTFTPMFTFNQYFFDRYLDYQFNETPVKARVVKGFTSAYDYSFTNSFRTNIYGTYNIKSKRLLAIRHTAIPTISHRYNPDFRRPEYNNFERGFTNGNENTTYYSRFSGAAYAPSFGEGFNGLSFNITNTLEGKVRTRQDTANPIKKINLINNIGLTGSYNFVDKANQHLNLSTIGINATTTLFKAINITFISEFDPYKYRLDSINPTTGFVHQTRVNPKFLQNAERSVAKLKRSEAYQLSLGGNLNPKVFKPKTIKNPGDQKELDFINANPDMYVDFNIPWNLNINYNFRFQRTGFAKSTFTQSLQVSGDLKVSENWKIAFTSGYDFVQKGIALTQLTINRDLHCWQMSFTVIPFGLRQSYFFTISAKSSILQDLKLNKRSPAFYGY
jgi:hypothetical protein